MSSVKTYAIAFKLSALLSSKYGKTFEKAESKAMRLANSMDKIGNTMTKALTLPLVAIGRASVLSAQEWESAWVGVRKVTNATEADLQALEATARQMARELPHTHNAIASVFEAGSRLGIATEYLEKFSRTMLAVESVTTLSLDKAASGFANIANVMGTSHGDFDRMGSTVLMLGNNFNTTEADILKMSSRMAGSANAIRMTESQLMGLAAATSAVGVEAAVGATAWNTLMSDVDIAVAKGGERLEEFAQIAGKCADSFAYAFREDAMGAITAFIGGLNRMEGEGGNVSLALYEMGFRADGIRSTLINLAGGYDTLIDAVQMGNSAWYENTELTKAVEERYATMEARLQIMRNQMRDAGITIGQALMPYVERLVGWLGNLAEWFSNLDQGTQRTIIRLALFTAAFGPLLKVGAKVIKFGGKMNAMYKTFTDTIKAVKTATELSTAAQAANVKLTKVSTAVTETAKKASAARKAATVAENKALKLAAQAELVRATSGAKSTKAIAAAAAAEKARTVATKAGKIANKHAATLDKIRANQGKVNEAVLLAQAKAQHANTLATSKFGKAIVFSTKMNTQWGTSLMATSVKLNAMSLSMKKTAGIKGILALGTKGLSVAFALMSKAIMAIPVFGWILAAITGVTAVVVALVKWVNRVGEEYKALAEETQNLRERQEQLAESAANAAAEFKNEMRIMQAMAERAETTAGSLEYLARMQEMNVAERERLNREAIVFELGLNDTYEKRLELEARLSDGTRRSRGERKALEGAIADLIEAENGYRDAIAANARQLDLLNGLYGDNVRALEEIQNAQREAEIAAYGYETAMRRMAFTAEEWADAQGEALSRMTASFESHKQAAGNAFSTINQNATIGFDEMIANMNANAAAVEKWSVNLAILTEKGLDEGLIEQLRQAGPAAAYQVAQLVGELEKVPERLYELNDAYANSTLVAMESMQREFDPEGVAKSAKELIDRVTLSILENTSMEYALIDKVNAGFGAFSETIDKAGFDYAGYNIAVGTAEGIESGSIHVERVMRAMVNRAIKAAEREADINSPSRRTMLFGEYIVDGMTIGMYSKMGELEKACRDISGLVTDNLTIDLPKVTVPSYASPNSGGYNNAFGSQFGFNRFANLNFDENNSPFQTTRPIDSINRMTGTDIYNSSGGAFHYHGSPITIDGSGLSADELEHILENRLAEERAAMQRYHQDQRAREKRLANV